MQPNRAELSPSRAPSRGVNGVRVLDSTRLDHRSAKRRDATGTRTVARCDCEAMLGDSSARRIGVASESRARPSESAELPLTSACSECTRDDDRRQENNCDERCEEMTDLMRSTLRSRPDARAGDECGCCRVRTRRDASRRVKERRGEGKAVL